MALKKEFMQAHEIIGDPPGTGPISVSKPTWYNWINSGYAPESVKFGPRMRVWRISDINEFIEPIQNGEG